MLQATASGDTKKFKRYNEFVYGSPSREIFRYIIHQLRTDIEQSSVKNIDVGEAGKDLSELLPSDLPATSLPRPTDEDHSRIKSATKAEISHLISITDERDVYDANAIKQTFEEALTTLKAGEWNVVIDPNRDAMAVSQEKKEVIVPLERKLTKEELEKFCAHEIGTHVGRRLRGNESRLQLLGLGLDRYERGEEGVATVREQAFEDEFSEYERLDRYVAISLAYGLDGKPRDFRDVFEFMEKYYFYHEIKNGKAKDSAKKKAQDQAWITTVRTFRGTDCNTPGVCFTKDIVYTEGISIHGR